MRLCVRCEEMTDGYWSRQQPQHLHSSSSLLKRPRAEYDLPPSGLPFSHEMMHNYLSQNDDIGGADTVKDTETIGSAYDHYLQSTIFMARPTRETLPLPVDASSTIFIEGLPANCTRREVAHIFRPFVGYKEVRLVSKESKHRGGDPLVISFVDFTTPACAATALGALQGYKVDEHDPSSSSLRLQFSKYPGPRSGPARRGRRR